MTQSPLVLQPHGPVVPDSDSRVWSTGRIMIRRKPKYSEKACLIDTLSTMSTWTALELNAGLHSEKLARYHCSYGMAISNCSEKFKFLLNRQPWFLLLEGLLPSIALQFQQVFSNLFLPLPCLWLCANNSFIYSSHFLFIALDQGLPTLFPWHQGNCGSVFECTQELLHFTVPQYFLNSSLNMKKCWNICCPVRRNTFLALSKI